MNGRPQTTLTAFSPQMLKSSNMSLYATKRPTYPTIHLWVVFTRFSSYFTHVSEFLAKEVNQPNPEMTCLKPKSPSTFFQDAFLDCWLSFTITNCLGHNKSEQTAGFEATWEILREKEPLDARKSKWEATILSEYRLYKVPGVLSFSSSWFFTHSGIT